MADNVHRKSHKQTEGSRKTSTPVHRTTSETIRLGEQLDRSHQTLGLSTPVSNSTSNNQCRKKTSSFQITSVTVGSRMSNDAGDDSNDDLDESHTEDNSVEHSRVTDLDVETPSYSEDTFSKEDVFFNASNSALSTAPVIPTSSQYGLAIVPSEGGNVNNSTNDGNINTLDINSVTDNNIINLLSSNTKQDADIREVHSHGRNERFKVVKIESTEPFKRGRWTCMDYLDHTSVSQSNAITTPKVTDPNEVCISYGITDSGIVVETSKQNIVVKDEKVISLDMNGHVGHNDVHSSLNVTNNSAGGFAVGNSIQQNVQQQHNASPLQSQVPTQQMPQYFQSSNQQQQQQQQQQQPQQPQQQQQQQLSSQQPQGGGQQGATLPSNLQPAHPNNLGQPQSMPQGSIPIITQTNNNNVSTQQQNMSHSKEDNAYVTVGSQNQSLAGQNVCQTSVQQTSGTTSQSLNILVTQQQQQQQHPSPQSQQQQQQQQQQQGLTAQKQMSQISEPMNTIQGIQTIQNIHKVPQSAGQQTTTSSIHGQGAPVQNQVMPPPTTAQMQTNTGSSQVQMSQVTGASGSGGGGGGGGNAGNAAANIHQQGSMNFHQPETEQDSVSGQVTAVNAADATLLESLVEVTQSNDDHQTLEDNESMSGTSAVAIDNKIEQAMDLVKSHLMFAVREEVEVLKEKIAELMDRINQLEAENSLLKAHATPETLAQLSQSTTKLSQNNSGSGQ